MEIQLFLLVKVWLRYVSLLAWVIACKILLSHVGNIFHDLIFPHKSLFRFAFRYLFTCCFCWIKALMAHLCHGSAMECRIRGGGMTVVLGEMEGARVKPKPMLLGRPLSSWSLVSHPKGQWRSTTSGGSSMFCRWQRLPGPNERARRGIEDRAKKLG